MKIVLIIILILVIFYLGVMLMGWLFSAPVYKGPVSDHFDGKKFINPGGVKPHGFTELMKWVRHRKPGKWVEIRDAVFGPAPASSVSGDTICVTFVNHSTFLIQTRGMNILTDPVWSVRASPVHFAGPKRMRPPGIRFEDLPKIDVILLTHNHYDHLDIQTLERLDAEHHPLVYCPLGVGGYLKRNGITNFKEMDWWDTYAMDDRVTLMCTPAQHFSGRGMFDRDRTLWCGFALVNEQGSIYYSGDTGYGNFFREIGDRIGPIRLAFLPIGAYKPEWFMAPIHTSPADALRIHSELHSARSIGMHFGTFPLADDGMHEAARELEALVRKEGIDKDSFIIPEEGKPLIFID